ncbi:hypothetical protein [Flavobacterium sp. HSC-61S13]|uniref:hypothetical protein n=1 Tax=Flavobacterium sp. HSC-61S13 TaxID=2910963 RepID=UPI0020A1278C|nr:hypothetical protein [Flavobacterium sp. HSC-61S13]MCP1997524.1 hypothetical protein [Flavobacterium sp. HSC-61S13]
MKTVNYFLLLMFLLISISCKKDRDEMILFEKYKGIKLTEKRSKLSENSIKYALVFPDTVKVNQAYEAIFRFSSDFDNIVEPMVDTVNFRTITFNYYLPIKIGNKIENHDIVLKDSILIPNKLFVLENVRFTEKGSFVFLALIEDRIMYNFYNDSGKRDSIHYDRKIQEIKKKVVVID